MCAFTACKRETVSTHSETCVAHAHACDMSSTRAGRIFLPPSPYEKKYLLHIVQLIESIRINNRQSSLRNGRKDWVINAKDLLDVGVQAP